MERCHVASRDSHVDIGCFHWDVHMVMSCIVQRRESSVLPSAGKVELASMAHGCYGDKFILATYGKVVSM